jgi:acetyl esterase/lipase
MLPATAQAATGSRVHVVRNVSIPTIDGARVKVDVWQQRRARAVRRRPVALLIHGGGWHSGDKRQWENSRWAQRLAARGWVVVNANYRMACGLPEPATAALAADAPASETAAAAREGGSIDERERDTSLCGHAMRTSIADVRQTLRYTAAHARAWGGDSQRIVLFGASAGAHLAMLAGSDRTRPKGVRAVVAISPPTDMQWIGADTSLPIYGSAEQSIGCVLSACPGEWRMASPVVHVRRGTTPPTWIFDAGADPITPIAPVHAYVARLRAAHVRTTLVTTADAAAECHGPIPCAGAPLANTRLDMFEHAQAWLAPLVR